MCAVSNQQSATKIIRSLNNLAILEYLGHYFEIYFHMLCYLGTTLDEENNGCVAIDPLQYAL